MRIDFVSDVVCPWCAIGLASLERAVRNSGVKVDMHVQPFELNPQMGAEGEDIIEHLQRKYRRTPQQIAEVQEMIRTRGAEVGFTFGTSRKRTYNTFDAHRLLHWAALDGRDLELKRALLKAYHGEGKDPSNHDTLVTIAASVGLDGEKAREVLRSGAFAEEVRDRERYYQELGISGVPAVIIDNKHLISGGQPVEVFEEALRSLSAERP